MAISRISGVRFCIILEIIYLVHLNRDLISLSFENALSALQDVRGSVRAISINFMVVP